MAERRRMIYIVEDDPTLGELEAHILNNEPDYEANWELLTPETFVRIQTKLPDLVLLEIPPSPSGRASHHVEFLDQLAADAQTSALPVAVIATDRTVADQVSTRPNVRAVIAKPYDVDVLLRAIAEALAA